MDPPSLIRTLSEHHWQYALSDMTQSKKNWIRAGYTKSFHDITWSYFLFRLGKDIHRITYRNNVCVDSTLWK